MPELIKDRINGYLVEPNVPEVTKAIAALLNDDSLRKKISDNAKFTAENDYNMEKCINKYVDILSEVLGYGVEASH